MHQGRRELATERPGFPETQTHSRFHHRKQESSQGLSSAAPGVVVVGSTTTALLVEALALAGMLRFRAPATDLVSQQTQVRRASTWPEAMELAGRYAPCMVVTTEAMPQGVCDATGAPVERTSADDLLELSRGTSMRETIAARATSVARAGWRWPRLRIHEWLERLQPAAMSRPARR